MTMSEFPVRGRSGIKSKRICLKSSLRLTVRCCRRGKVPRSLRTRVRRQEMTRLLRKVLLSARQIHEKIPREHVACLPQQGPFRHFMDMKAEKRLAGWKERRSRYGDINVHKRYQFGKIFSPFQALATTEMQRLVLPQDLSMNPHMQKMGISCTAKGNLQDLSLSSTELGLGKDDDNHEKEKPASHIKRPLFPPIVKVTKSNDMK
nr:uncharacterized protein LOC100629368 isoform X4 [Equus caballus]